MFPLKSVLAGKLAIAGAAGLLATGIAATTAVSAAAASPTPTTSPAQTSAGHKHKGDGHQDRRQIATAVFEAEADVLGMKPDDLRAALKAGKTVEQLAQAKGLSKDAFAAALVKNLKPRLDKLVDSKAITRAQADRVLDRIAKGHIPFWTGRHHHKK